MSTLLIFAGFALAAVVCCGIKALVWLAGARPAGFLPTGPGCSSHRRLPSLLVALRGNEVRLL